MTNSTYHATEWRSPWKQTEAEAREELERERQRYRTRDWTSRFWCYAQIEIHADGGRYRAVVGYEVKS